MSVKLNAEVRTQIGNALQTARKAGKVPAVVYGSGKNATNVFVNQSDFAKVYRSVGRTKLFTLEVNGESKGVLVMDIQRHALTDNPIHIDFIEVDQNKEMTISVPVHLINEAPAVKNKGAIVRAATILEIKVSCLPKNLISHVDADLSHLEDFNQHILVSDLKLPAGVKLLSDPTMVIAAVRHPRKQEDLSTPVVATTEMPEATAQKSPEQIAAEAEAAKKTDKK